MKFYDLFPIPTPRILRQFAVAWLVIFSILAGRAFAHGNCAFGGEFSAIALLSLIGLIKPSIIRRPFMVAMAITFPFGWLMTQLVLVILFYLVLTPIAFIFRWRGLDELHLRRQFGKKSFWQLREKPKVERYLKQF